jgi:hypothetical protein
VLRLVRDLLGLPIPVVVRIVFPSYLAETQAQIVEAANIGLDHFTKEAELESFTLSRQISRRLRGPIERGAQDEGRGLRLLALAHSLRADALVTSIPTLFEASGALRRFHSVRLMAPDELPDFVEICARGNDIFCAAGFATSWVAPDVFYLFANSHAKKFAEWYGRLSSTLTDPALLESLRSALLNRYPFILYSRDLIHFYEIQKQHWLRRQGPPAVFRLMVNYHLTAFYLHAWGMLDSFAGIANKWLGLGVHPRKCYIARDDFLEALELVRPSLAAFIRHHAEWIETIGDVRHPAAHSALVLQRDVARSTKESQKTDEEIAQIIRKEEHEFLSMVPSEFRQTVEATLISNWRHRHLSVENDDAIYVEKADGRAYLRGPVVSVDHDLVQLTTFVETFLDACSTP